MAFAVVVAAPTAPAFCQDTTSPSVGDRATSVRVGAYTLSPSLRVGDRVRVRVGTVHRITGKLRELRGDTLVVSTSLLGIEWREALDRTRRLDVRVGRRPRARGAAIGAVGGALAAVAFGVTIVHGFGGSLTRNTDVVGEVAVLAMPYAVTAGIICGAVWPGDRWRKVEVTNGTH